MLKQIIDNSQYEPLSETKLRTSKLNLKYCFYENLIGKKKMEEIINIDITDDYIFKEIFGDEARMKNFLISVLVGDNKILPLGTEIHSITYIKNEYIQKKVPEEAKKSLFDLQITTNYGIYIVEMQKDAKLEYLKRVEFYSSISYSQQNIKGLGETYMQDYEKALPIVTITMIANKIFEDDVPCVSYHRTTENKTQRQYMKSFSYVFIELGKFDNPKYDQGTINNNDEKDWLSLFKTQDLGRHYHNKQVNRAVEHVQYIKANKFDEYVRHQLAIQVEKNRILSAKEEGIAIGEEKGIAIGEAKGKIDIVKKMLIKGKSIEEIVELTDLNNKEIEDIRKSL